MKATDTISQYGRIRRLANRYCWGVQTQLSRIQVSQKLLQTGRDTIDYVHYDMKNDWEALSVLLVRLRRCFPFLESLKPELCLDPAFAEQFDVLLPSLSKLRNFEEHWDEYSRGDGRNTAAAWGHLETYTFGVDHFSNGVGSIEAKNAQEASTLTWKAVLSLEDQAKAQGFLTFDDRYGPHGKFRRTI
ncbi:MAG: hypothetical protein AAGH82_06170 [Pseudomonadota bacterium]